MKSMNQTCLVLGGWQRFAIQQMFLALTQILVGCLIPSTSFLLWNLLAAVEEMVFDDGTRQSVICYRGTSAILFALFYQCNRAGWPAGKCLWCGRERKSNVPWQPLPQWPNRLHLLNLNIQLCSGTLTWSFIPLLPNQGLSQLSWSGCWKKKNNAYSWKHLDVMV